jgi:hypothetical protein
MTVATDGPATELPRRQALRETEAAWLRGYAADFWRKHDPERFRAIHRHAVGLSQEPEYWHLKFDLTLRPHPRKRKELKTARAVDELVRRFGRAVAREAAEHVLFLYAIALTDSIPRPHVHGVMSFPPGHALPAPDVLDIWLSLSPYSGPSSVVGRYDAEKGAIYYMLSHGGYEVPKVACPRTARCRRGACLGSAAPWRPAEATLFPGRQRTALEDVSLSE